MSPLIPKPSFSFDSTNTLLSKSSNVNFSIFTVKIKYDFLQTAHLGFGLAKNSLTKTFELPVLCVK